MINSIHWHLKYNIYHLKFISNSLPNSFFPESISQEEFFELLQETKTSSLRESKQVKIFRNNNDNKGLWTEIDKKLPTGNIINNIEFLILLFR